MLPAEDIVRAIEAYFAAISRRDVDAWLACIAPDAVSFSPVGAPPIRGHQDLRLLFREFTRMVSSVQVTVEDIFPGGGSAAAKWVARGEGHEGQPVTFGGINVFQFDGGGRICQIHAYYDPESVVRQLNRQDGRG